jgi:hypothetical protein
VLRGESPARIAFLKQLVDAAPKNAGPLKERHTWGVEGEYYLAYFSDRQPAVYAVALPAQKQFRAELIDTWEMTITPVAGTFSEAAAVRLPRKPYQAVRLTPAQGG